MTSGVAEKGAGAGKIVGQKTEQRPAGQKRDERDEVLARERGKERKAQRADGSKTGAKSIHVVHEIEGVDEGENPQDRDGVAEDYVRNEQGDPRARRRHQSRDEELTGEFRRWL